MAIVVRIRADHDQLSQISQGFGREADKTRQTLDRLKQSMEVLKNGDWIGKGATAFYQEMESSILPAVQRLVNAMEMAQRITRQISQVMKDVEEESSHVFDRSGQEGGGAESQGGGASGGASGGGDAGGAAAGAAAGAMAGGASGGGSGGASGGGSGGASGGGSGGAPSGGSPGGASGGGSGGSSGGGAPAGGAPGGGSSGGSSGGGASQANTLVAREPSQVFSEGNLGSMVNANTAGAGSNELRDAMLELANNPTGEELDKVLEKIAKLRGRPLSEIKKEYEKFLKVRAQAAAIAAAKGLPPPPPLSEVLQGNFMASQQQLNSGGLVGQTFGIDPVFGAMLNPQGGMASGNVVPGANTVAGLNEATSDAGNYLKTFHNVGPGANYLPQGTDANSFWTSKGASAN